MVALYDRQDKFSFLVYIRIQALLMRSISHPGIPACDRAQVVSASAEQFEVILQAGQSFLSAMRQALAAKGVVSAAVRLQGGAFEPFCYVMPALSRTPDHAVYFSDRFDVPGRVHLETGTVTVGLRDGAPWLHCHAIWVEPDGSRRCGHLLPEDVIVSAPIRATVCALHGAAFEVTPDAETNFSLFVPVPTHAAHEMRDRISQTSGVNDLVLAVRLLPNIDVCMALEQICAQRGITRAIVHGGVGSTVGAAYDDGRIVEPFVTELLIRHGRIEPDAMGVPRAQLDISMVDYTGGLSEGRLLRGANPVLVTCELVLQPCCRCP